MSVLRYVRLDVFTNQPFTGIQLAMFPDAAGIDERRMQAVGPCVTDGVAVPRQSACNRATLQTETCRCKSRPPEFHFCMFRCVRARRSMRHPSSVGDYARYSGPWISKSSLYLYSRA